MTESAPPPSPLADFARQLLNLPLVRFGVVGVSNTVVSYSVFWAAHHAVSGAASQALSYAAGTVWSYYWNRRWTFQSTSALAGEAFRFIGLQAVFMVISAVAMGALVDRWHQPSGLSWLGVAAVVTVLNFVASRYWAFRTS